MPDSFEHMPTVAVRMPNGALSSLAGNIDSHHQVAVADLILVQHKVRETVEQLVRRAQPRRCGTIGNDLPAQDCAANYCSDAFPAARKFVSWSAATTPVLPPMPTCKIASGIDYIVRGEGRNHLPRALARDRAGRGIPSDSRPVVSSRRRLARKSLPACSQPGGRRDSACRSAMRAC